MINKFTLVSSKHIQLKVYKTKQIGNKNVLTLLYNAVRWKGNIKTWHFGIGGSYNNLAKHFFSKSLHPTLHNLQSLVLQLSSILSTNIVKRGGVVIKHNMTVMIVKVYFIFCVVNFGLNIVRTNEADPDLF